MRIAAVFSGLIAFWVSSAALAADSAVVFMYHRFGEGKYPSTNTRVEQLEAQLDYLDSEGFTVIPLERLIDALDGGDALPDNAVVITIDDAYRTVYEVAHSMLEKRGFPYTVFVAVDGIDEGIPDYMSWEQMRELKGSGASFANHGGSHTSFLEPPSGADRANWIEAEIERGRERLEDEGLDPVEGAFAYPYGEFDETAMEILDDEGYEIAFGQQSGAVGPMSRPLALPRYPINEAYGSLDEFRTRARSLPLPVESVSPPDNAIDTRLPLIELKLAGGRESGGYSGLACFVSGQGRVEVEWTVPGERLSVGPEKPLAPGRSRVNCTAPAGDGRYYWYSHPWFVKP